MHSWPPGRSTIITMSPEVTFGPGLLDAGGRRLVHRRDPQQRRAIGERSGPAPVPESARRALHRAVDRSLCGRRDRRARRSGSCCGNVARVERRSVTGSWCPLLWRVSDGPRRPCRPSSAVKVALVNPVGRRRRRPWAADWLVPAHSHRSLAAQPGRPRRARLAGSSPARPVTGGPAGARHRQRRAVRVPSHLRC